MAMLGLGLKIRDVETDKGGRRWWYCRPAFEGNQSSKCHVFRKIKASRANWSFDSGLILSQGRTKTPGRLERRLPWSIGKAGNSNNGPTNRSGQNQISHTMEKDYTMHLFKVAADYPPFLIVKVAMATEFNTVCPCLQRSSLKSGMHTFGRLPEYRDLASTLSIVFYSCFLLHNKDCERDSKKTAGLDMFTII